MFLASTTREFPTGTDNGQYQVLCEIRPRALPRSSQALSQFGPAAVAESNTPMSTRVSIAYPFDTSSVCRQDIDQIVSKVLPRLRMLRLVLERKPISFCPHKSETKYVVTYYQETLECGHETISYAVNPAKRRSCATCVALSFPVNAVAKGATAGAD